MPNAWFETVAEAQRRARKRLPPSACGAVVAGTEKGRTLAGNSAAFDEFGFAPRVVGLSAKREMVTTVMGQQIALPVVISPTGVQAVHPGGEVAVAANGQAVQNAAMPGYTPPHEASTWPHRSSAGASQVSQGW